MADKITKLSDAIRLGSTFRPQCRVRPFAGGASCALGAAFEALGNDYDPSAMTDKVKRYLVVRFPSMPDEILEDVWRLNDFGGYVNGTTEGHPWTREQIADDLAKKGY